MGVLYSKAGDQGSLIPSKFLKNLFHSRFIVVLILASCFTGCNYWRRQRRSQHFRLFQRQYTSISGGGLRNTESSSGGPQIVIPITMYEVSPDVILRLMRENASYHTTASTLSSSSGYGSPRFYAGGSQHRQGGDQLQQQQQDRSLLQGPPSYCEVWLLWASLGRVRIQIWTQTRSCHLGPESGLASITCHVHF